MGFRRRHAAKFVLHHLARRRGQVAFAEPMLGGVVMVEGDDVRQFGAGEGDHFAKGPFQGNLA
ncbi:MAG: hypothetical protein COB10_13330 [Planctomycetota bacterium]|nr:MAG: hypothetical protein COB10_13330 [Planctomycetota bacterium]